MGLQLTWMAMTGSTTGGFAQRIVVPREVVFKLPSTVSLEEGGESSPTSALTRMRLRLPALVEPLAVAWHAIKNTPFKEGDDTLVIGAGPVGLAVIQVLKAWGAGRILVSELSTRRQELAKHFGATHLLDPKSPDVVAQCKEICDGEGPAIVVDAAGVQAGLDLAFAASRSGATIVNIATWKDQPRVNAIALLLGEKRYVGTMVHVKEDFAGVIEAVGSGKSVPSYLCSASLLLAVLLTFLSRSDTTKADDLIRDTA